MAESTSVSGTVSVQSDSKERVALELMYQVDQFAEAGIPKDKAYWLTLYHQCLRTVRGNDPANEGHSSTPSIRTAPRSPAGW